MKEDLKTIQLQIGGMSCISCQNRIQKKLICTNGIKSAAVNYNNGTADISYDPAIITPSEISGVIEELGYHVLTAGRHTRADSGRIAALLITIVALYVLLQRSGILNWLVPGRLADSEMGYGMLFVIGLITSVHCVAMCGGISLSQCLPRSSGTIEKSRRFSAFRPALLYNLGRVISYTVIGALLGAAGLLFGGRSGTGLPVMAQGVLKLAAGMFMVIMGLNMLGIFPALRRLQPRMPGLFSRLAGSTHTQGRGPLIVGLLNGLMPCGPLQSMQIVALASGSPLAGALSMLLFSLGTVPLMLGLGSVISALGQKFAQKVMRIGAVLVVVLGLAMLSQGGSLSGLLLPDTLLAVILALTAAGIISGLRFSHPLHRAVSSAAVFAGVIVVFTVWNILTAGSDAPASVEAAARTESGIQTITSTLSAGRLPDIKVTAGVPVKWTIHASGDSLNGCNNRINIPQYDITGYTLRQGDNIIEFTPDKTGTVQYSCWMGMLHGSITVTAGQTDADASDQSENQTPEISDNSDAADNPNASEGNENSAASSQTASATVKDGVQYVTSGISGGQYEPISVQQGIPVKWTLNAPANELNGCNNQIVIPAYNLQVSLKAGDNTIEFTPAESGTFTFSCWMGMVRSEITVVGSDGTVADNTDDGSAQLPAGCCSVSQ